MDVKIVLFLADGMRPDIMTACGNPFVRELMAESVYTLNGSTVMPTVTLPCHMSLFHSVPPDRHGILTNAWQPQVRPVRGICEVLKAAGKRCGLLYDWEDLRNLTRPGSLKFTYFISSQYEETMPKVREEAIRRLRENDMDFLFVYFGLPDHIGHRHGFTTDECLAGVSAVWDNLKIMKEALPPEYSLIVTSDHGGHGRAHGEDCPEDMTIPILFHGDAFRDLDAGKVETANIMDIAPTLAHAMGIPPDPDWEGKDLF